MQSRMIDVETRVKQLEQEMGHVLESLERIRKAQYALEDTVYGPPAGGGGGQEEAAEKPSTPAPVSPENGRHNDNSDKEADEDGAIREDSPRENGFASPPDGGGRKRARHNGREDLGRSRSTGRKNEDDGRSIYIKWHYRKDEPRHRVNTPPWRKAKEEIEQHFRHYTQGNVRVNRGYLWKDDAVDRMIARISFATVEERDKALRDAAYLEEHYHYVCGDSHWFK